MSEKKLTKTLKKKSLLNRVLQHKKIVYRQNRNYERSNLFCLLNGEARQSWTYNTLGDDFRLCLRWRWFCRQSLNINSLSGRHFLCGTECVLFWSNWQNDSLVFVCLTRNGSLHCEIFLYFDAVTSTSSVSAKSYKFSSNPSRDAELRGQAHIM